MQHARAQQQAQFLPALAAPTLAPHAAGNSQTGTAVQMTQSKTQPRPPVVSQPQPTVETTNDTGVDTDTDVLVDG